MLQKFYFLFSSYETNTPYKAGWITVLANTQEDACNFIHKQCPGFYNQEFIKNKIYDEKTFKATYTYKTYNHLGQNCLKTYNAYTGEEVKKPTLDIYNLCIEVTRKCNMSCPHCLRGDSENIDMDFNTIIPILAHTQSISQLTFTGGEPTLNIALMEKVLEYVKEHGIAVRSFYIVTNGKEITNEFLLLLHKWYNYTNQYAINPEENGICISKDIFHEPIPKENEIALQSFSFYKDDKVTDWESRKHYLIKDGRAKDLQRFTISFIDPCEEQDVIVEKDEKSNKYIIQEELYVSAKGEITANCDYSYEKMAKYAIGTTTDIEAFFEYLNTITE